MVALFHYWKILLILFLMISNLSFISSPAGNEILINYDSISLHIHEIEEDSQYPRGSMC